MDVGAVIDSVTWCDCPAPETFDPGALRSALYGLRHADSEQAAAWAAARLEEAAADGHSGTLFPVGVPAVPVLLAVAVRWPGEGRGQALAGIDQLLYMAPHPEFGFCSCGEGPPRPLRDRMLDRLADGIPLLESIVAAPQPWPGTRRQAWELLVKAESRDIFAEPPPKRKRRGG